jgi:hypothetical protein
MAAVQCLPETTWLTALPLGPRDGSAGQGAADPSDLADVVMIGASKSSMSPWDADPRDDLGGARILLQAPEHGEVPFIEHAPYLLAEDKLSKGEEII